MFKYFVFADPPGKKMLVQFNEHAEKHMTDLELDVVSEYCNTCILQLLFEFSYIQLDEKLYQRG